MPAARKIFGALSARATIPRMVAARNEEATPGLRVTHNGSGLLMGMIGPVCLALWQGKPTPERFVVQRSHLHAAVQRDPGKVVFLCVVAAKADPPEEAERRASAEMITSQGNRLLGVACVVEGVGFRAAITRTVLSGMLMVIRTPAPIKLFESVRLSAPFLARCLSRSSLPQLEAECERARALLIAGQLAT